MTMPRPSLRVGIAGREVGDEAAAAARLEPLEASAASRDITPRSSLRQSAFCTLMHVLVAAAGQVDQQDLDRAASSARAVQA